LFCEQQAHDLLCPYVMVIMSLQIILRMRRDMSGEELDRATATVLANLELSAERLKRRQWVQRIENAAKFQSE
jgi:hypothetical protein